MHNMCDKSYENIFLSLKITLKWLFWKKRSEKVFVSTHILKAENHSFQTVYAVWHVYGTILFASSTLGTGVIYIINKAKMQNM